MDRKVNQKTMKFKKLILLSLIASLSYVIKAESYVLTASDLTVNESGVITDCSYDFTNKDITIPEKVGEISITGIADVSVFGAVKIFYSQGISSVEFPATMTAIGENAFKGNDLVSITLPSNLERIGKSAFNGNGFDFKEVTIPSSVIYIGEFAFSMNGIDSITLPETTILGFKEWVDHNGVTYAGGEKVEYGSEEFRAKVLYTLNDDDVELDTNGMITACTYDFTFTDIIIPDSLDGQKVVGVASKSVNGVFGDKGITSLELPEGIAFLGDLSFEDNELVEILVPEQVEYIGRKAFASNDMESVTLPNSVIYIGQQAFYSIDSIVLPSPIVTGFEYWTSTNGESYEPGTKVELGYSTFEAKIVYTLTDNDVSINNGVIDSCMYDFSSKYIKIPDTLNNQRVLSISDGKEPSFGISVGVFYGKGIKEVQLPSSLDSIGGYTFYNNDLDSMIVLPTNIKFIGIDAFTGNPEFKGIVLPSPTTESKVCVNWVDNYNNSYEIGDTVTNFYSRYYSAQFAYPEGTPAIAMVDSISFDDVVINSSDSVVLNIINDGTSVLSITEIILPDGFSANWTAGEINAADSQTVYVKFSPIAIKSYSGLIKVVSDAKYGVDSVVVSGSTIGSGIELSETLFFDNVAINTEETAVLTISNKGNVPLSVSGINLQEGFTADWTNGIIAQDSSQAIEVTFLPTELKEYSAWIKVLSNASIGIDSIEVKASVVASEIELSEAIDFNEVDVDDTKEMTLMIANKGNISLVISDVVLSDGYTADWTSGEVLAGKEQEVTISFSPTEIKTYSGEIEVVSDAMLGVNSISVNGEGVKATSISNPSVVEFKLYPNPVVDYIMIDAELSDKLVEVINLNGQTVWSGEAIDGKIDVNGLGKGLYVVRIENDGEVLQSKFLKE